MVENAQTIPVSQFSGEIFLFVYIRSVYRSNTSITHYK